MEIQKEEKDKKSKLYLFILIGVLLALNIGLGINLWMDKKENTQLSQENNKVTAENKDLQVQLSELEADFKESQDKNTELNTQLEAKDQLIANKVAEIKKLISKGNLTHSELQKAKNDIASLRNEIEDYKAQIEALTQKNKELTDENTNLSTNLSAEQGKNSELSQQNSQLSQTVSVAKRLKASSVTVVGLGDRMLSNKLKVTSKASKVEELKIVVNVNENQVADAGDKNVYVKIIAPDGSPMATNANTIDVEGTQSLYTTMQTLDYKNKAETITMYWKKGSEFAKGEYTVEVFGDGYRMGQSKFTFK